MLKIIQAHVRTFDFFRKMFKTQMFTQVNI